MTVEGDLDGNGKPDVTLRPRGVSKKPIAFQVSSSGNRLHALALRGFFFGVSLQPRGKRVPSHRKFTDIVVSALVMRGIGADGIHLGYLSGDCGLPKPQCRSYNGWANTTLTGNTIEARRSGIKVDLFGAIGDRVERATVTDNTIRIGERAKPNSVDVGISFDQGGNSTWTRISDVLIARNSIEGVNGNGGIVVAPGVQRAQANTMDGVRIFDNRIHLVSRGSEFCCQGIVVQAGSDTVEATYPRVRPYRYPDRNVLRNVQVRGNSISGTLVWGVSVQAGIGAGGSRNRIENVHLERNVIRSSNVAFGVYAWVGVGTPYKNRYATGNRIDRVTLDANRITTRNRNPLGFEENFGGIVLQGGGTFGRGGVVRDVRITRNRIATAQPGIRLIGGRDSTARGNSVTCVRLAGNRITGTRHPVSVTPNLVGASGNRASLGGC